MKKRIIALFALVTIMATMLSVPVSAELIVNDTFDTPPVSGNLADVPGWASYSASMIGNVSFPNGALKITHTDSTVGRPFWRKSFTVPSKEFVLMFDFMMEDVGRISWLLTASSTASSAVVPDKRAIYNSLGTANFTADVWHDIMIRSYNGGKNISLHYKKKSDGVWTEITIVHPVLSDDWVSGLTGEYMLGWDVGSRLINYSGKGMSIDNFRVFTGDFVEFDGFKFGTTKVEDVTEVNAAGTLKADYEVYTDDVSFVAGSTARTYELQSTPLKTIMISYDKNMKILDCNVVNTSIKGGSTECSNQLIFGDISTKDNYYRNVSDDGCVRLYFWKGMKPLQKGITLD